MVKVTTIDSLITNPSTCAAGHWNGNVSVTFPSGSFSRPLTIPFS